MALFLPSTTTTATPSIPSPPRRRAFPTRTSAYALDSVTPGRRTATAATGASSPSSDRAFSGYFSSASHCGVPTSSPWNGKVLGLGRLVRCRAVGEGPPEALERVVYQGVYGPWTVEDSDVREVILYRSGLVTAATSFVLAASTAFLPEGSIFGNFLKHNLDLLYVIGAGGLGVSLFLIHIYVTLIKRFLQVLWAVGVFGSLATYLTLAQPLDESLTQYVLSNPVAIWFVGPLFASLTGLVFKEGLCYGKLEAGILTFTIPILLLGHLSGLMDDGVKHGLLGIWMALFVIFAARKFSQPTKDDIGDKSVFMFNALSEEEKKKILQRLQQQQVDENFNYYEK